MRFSLYARLTAEFVGTAFLLMAVIGSGIMGERLSAGNVAIALLANTIATGAALVALILTFGPISGAHLNPAVTLADASQHGVPWSEAPAYIAAQVLGGYLGVLCAHLMFAFTTVLSLTAQSCGRFTDVQRVHCDLWSIVRDMGLFATSLIRRAVRGGSLHHGGVLVHRIDFLRQPRRYPCEVGNGHVQRNQSRRCPRFYSYAVTGSGCSNGDVQVLGSDTPRHGT